MNEALLKPAIGNDNPLNLAFKEQSQINSTAGDTCDSDTDEQPNGVTAILTPNLNYAEENGQMAVGKWP